MNDDIFVSAEELDRQKNFEEKNKKILFGRLRRAPKAYVHTFGCQGNVSDGERIKGELSLMGYEFTDKPDDADFVLYNTCAVREHAEDRVFGNVGALKPIKEKNKSMIIAVCGCMAQQKNIADVFKKSYPYVNLVFGTFASYRLPENIYKILTTGKRVFDTVEEPGRIAEGIPAVRDNGARAWLPIMYGCNNFCTYCIVPYVRGRERSRKPEDILAEAQKLISEGAKDITLLGQNVNSYGLNADYGVDFPDLLRMINDLPGDFIIRFMTSHPKDLTNKLIDTIAESEKCVHHIHLPVQSGSDRILKLMNRHYTRERYLEIVDYAREKIPDVSLTSDIIVGFPGETRKDFEDTLSLVEKVKYTSLFTFIYSPRPGTLAAKMDDPTPSAEKSKWFKELCDLQSDIASQRTAAMVGKTYRVLVEKGDEEGYLMGRTGGNVAINFKGDDSLVGEFTYVKVTKALTWIVYGEKV
jgi:tRNA-2-methylthio-N6-dimethylallyladenosine synthase